MSPRFRYFFRRYRFLMYFYVPALVLAAWENAEDLYPDGKEPNKRIAAVNNQYSRRYTQLYRELYPNYPMSEYYRGIDALVGKHDVRDAREHFKTP